MLNPSELKQKDHKELSQLLETKRHDLWIFRFGGSGARVRNVKEGQEIRRDIARILTAMSQTKA